MSRVEGQPGGLGKIHHVTVRERVGYRGLVLLWLGSMFALIGLSLIPSQPEPIPNLWHTRIGLPWRVIVWVVPGIVSVGAGIMNAWTHRWQIPAFVLLVIPPGLRCVSFASAAVLDQSWPRLASSLVYAVLVAGVLLIASWPEPQKTRGLDARVTNGDMAV